MALSLQRYTFYSKPSFDRILKERILKERQASSTIPIELGDVYLPETLIVEILSWLPVKSLLQFKSVCKSWCAIITSTHFASKHIQHYYNNNNNSDCLLVHYHSSQAELDLHELLLDETPRVLAHKEVDELPIYRSYIYGPCDGIYYLFDYKERALWNPAINDLKLLPPIVEKPNLPSNLFYPMNEVYGFGFDPSTNDYKVVVIQGLWMDRSDDSNEVFHPSMVFIYSLRSDSWRYWGDLAHDYRLEINKCYIHLNRCFYWIGTRGSYEVSSEVMVCFDLTIEEYREIELPNCKQSFYESLGIYDNTIAFLCVHEIEETFDVWTLNDDGLWTKKFTIGPIPELWHPIGHWINNKFLIEYWGWKLHLCDIDTKEIMDLAYKGGHMCEGIFVYKESLVSLKGYK